MRINLFLLLFLIAFSDICDTANQLLLKSAVNSLEEAAAGNIRLILRFILKLIRLPRVWLGLSFSTLSLVIWLFVLSKADLNFAFSLDSMQYIFVAFASKIVLKEKVGPGRWFGTMLIVTGIILVSLS